MKELEIKTKDKVVITAQQEKKYEHKLVRSIRPHKGHTLFKVCEKTGDISEAEFEKQDLQIKDLSNPLLGAVKKKVIIEEGFIYISALNKKNVIKKLTKQ